MARAAVVKSISRDIGVLKSMLGYMYKMNSCLKKRYCLNLESFSKREDCRDTCSFYLTQIYALGNKLSDESKNSISFIKDNSITPIRNLIINNYSGLQISVLYAIVLSCSSQTALSEVKDRLKLCKSLLS